MTKTEMLALMREYNARHGNEYGVATNKKIYFVITYAQSNFTRQYTPKERAYIVASNSGKACYHGLCGNSLIGDCMDGRDIGVRLDAYDWTVESIFQIPEHVARACYGEQ